jgi:hypothetical protein
MNDEAIHGDPIVKSNEFSPNDEHRGVSRPIARRAPNLKSSLGTRMGKAANMPVLVLISDSATECDVGSVELKDNTEAVESGDNVVNLDHVPAVDARQLYSAPTRSDQNLRPPTQQSFDFTDGIWWRRPIALLAACVLVFSAGMLAGFLGRGDSGKTAALEIQKREIEGQAARLKAQDQRLLVQEAETQRKSEEFKRLVDEAESKRRMNEEDLIAKIDEALKNSEAYRRLAEEAETKRQDAQNEFDKVVSFVSLPEEGISSWPPDPPKVVAPGGLVDSKIGNPSQKWNYVKAPKKQRAPSIGMDNNN